MIEGRVLVHDVRSVRYVFWEARLKVDSQLDWLLILPEDDVVDLPIATSNVDAL